MSVSTAELTAPAASPPSAQRGVRPRWLPTGGRLYVALGAAALAVGALSLLIPSTPSYDPWAWLVWGREIVHLKLHTTGGPTWKPLPVLFTTVFALFGKAAPDLWLVIARAGALMAVVMTFKVASRITRDILSDAGEVRRLVLPALLAGAIAAASLINGRGFISDNALGYSEGLMTALVLMAIDRHLDGARRQAFGIGFFAALDRPELWLFWGPYGLYLFFKEPGSRKLVIALFALIPVLWFLPEYWGSGHFLRGVSRAQHPRSNSPAFAKCPFCTEFSQHAWPLVLWRIKGPALAAAVVAVFGLWRTRRTWRLLGWATPPQRGRALVVMALVASLAWWLLIGVLTQAGFSGNDRYLVLGAALLSISGGVAWGWLAHLIGRLLQRVRVPATPSIGIATVGCAVLLLTAPNWVGPSVIDVQATHRALVYQAHLRQDLNKLVARLGGSAKILRCGTVMTEGFQVPMVAWNLGVHTIAVQASPVGPPLPPAPNVIFQTRAQRNASLLPHVYDWKNVPYQLVAHVRTFRVYSHCANKVDL